MITIFPIGIFSEYLPVDSGIIVFMFYIGFVLFCLCWVGTTRIKNMTFKILHYEQEGDEVKVYFQNLDGKMSHYVLTKTLDENCTTTHTQHMVLPGGSNMVLLGKL